MKYLICLFLCIVFSSCAATPYPKGHYREKSPLLVTKRTASENEIDLRDFVRPKEVTSYLDSIITEKKADMFTLRILTEHVRSLPNPKEKKDFWNYPKETIKFGGDCEDRAHLLLSLAIACGFENIYAVKGNYRKNFFYKNIGHLWVEADIDGICYLIETLPEKEAIRKKVKSAGYFPYFKYNNTESYIFRRDL